MDTFLIYLASVADELRSTLAFSVGLLLIGTFIFILFFGYFLEQDKALRIIKRNIVIAFVVMVIKSLIPTSDEVSMMLTPMTEIVLEYDQSVDMVTKE